MDGVDTKFQIAICFNHAQGLGALDTSAGHQLCTDSLSVQNPFHAIGGVDLEHIFKLHLKQTTQNDMMNKLSYYSRHCLRGSASSVWKVHN